MTGTHCRVIIDAVALIDFLDSNPSALRLISDHLGRLAAVYEVVCEVDGLDSATCGELGIEIVDANVCQGAIADDRPSGLSRPDHLCLLVAKENRWTCLTNDRRLRRECTRHGVPVMSRLLQLRYQTNQTCPFRGTLRVPSGTKPCRVPRCAALCATWYVAATLRQKGRTQSTSRQRGLSRALRGHMEYRMVFSPS